MNDLNATILIKINRLIGKNRWLDAFGRAGAEWVVLASAAWYATGVFMTRDSWPKIFSPLIFLAGAWLVGLLFGFLVSLAVKEPRPYISQPNLKVLFRPLSNWKSFPSDHTMSAFLIFFIGLVFQLPAAWSLLPLAIWVAWGRLYAGVHYPLDILGGICMAGLLTLTVKYIMLFYNYL